MRRFWSVAVCLLVLGVSCARPHPPVKPAPIRQVPPPPPPAPPKTVVEVRAVWVSDTARLDWNAATRDLQQAGFNTMYVNLASAGAAFYPGSKVLPSVVTGNPDPVSLGIELAHRRGVTVHAKQIVMFAFKAPREFQRKLLESDRVMRGADGLPIMQSGFHWLCPSQSVNRDQMAASVTEMVSRYPVDGVQFDYIRFFEEPTCFCKHCREEFEKFAGKPMKSWPADVLTGSAVARFNEWRERVITDWARTLSTAARQARPGIKVSAAVFPVLERAREEKAQDWRLWLERGYLDVICPMNYSPNSTEFDQRCRGVLKWAPRERVVMGIGSWKFDRPEGVAGQVAETRQLKTAGFALFSYDDVAARGLPLANCIR